MIGSLRGVVDTGYYDRDILHHPEVVGEIFQAKRTVQDFATEPDFGPVRALLQVAEFITREQRL